MICPEFGGCSHPDCCVKARCGFEKAVESEDSRAYVLHFDSASFSEWSGGQSFEGSLDIKSL